MKKYDQNWPNISMNWIIFSIKWFSINTRTVFHACQRGLLYMKRSWNGKIWRDWQWLINFGAISRCEKCDNIPCLVPVQFEVWHPYQYLRIFYPLFLKFELQIWTHLGFCNYTSESSEMAETKQTNKTKKQNYNFCKMGYRHIFD